MLGRLRFRYKARRNNCFFFNEHDLLKTLAHGISIVTTARGILICDTFVSPINSFNFGVHDANEFRN